MNLAESTLAQIVTRKPAAATVFESHNLDYCCNGRQTLLQACQGDHARLRLIVRELETVLFYEEESHRIDFSEIPLEELIAHILNKHHRYVKDATPRILAHLQKASTKHGHRHPQLHEIHVAFADASDEIGQHMYKEEHILFPRIREIAEVVAKEVYYHEHERSYLSGPIHVMEAEHEQAASILRRIRKLTQHYTAPADACTTFRLAYQELNEYELDLHRYVHLENNILFPRAMKLERRLGASHDENFLHSTGYEKFPPYIS